MPILANILISGLVAITSFVGAYKYLPLSLFETLETQTRTYGSTITTIAGSDTLSASRSVINTNFSNLNTDKFELSDWYATTSAAQITTLANLATVGTITSGTWSGTAIAVAKGGTGTTSPSANLVMIGDTTSGLKAVAPGTAQQVLTSNGVGADPSFQSAIIDQTTDYNFTGATRIKNLHASSTAANPITLNGVAYNTPSTQGAATTTLFNDGSGNLTWLRPEYSLVASTTLATQTSASTTLSWSGTGGSDLKIIISIPAWNSGVTNVYANFNADTGTNYTWGQTTAGTRTSAASDRAFIMGETGSAAGVFYADININNVASSTKIATWTGFKNTAELDGGVLWNNTTSKVTSITIGSGTGAVMSAGTRISIYASRE